MKAWYALALVLGAAAVMSGVLSDPKPKLIWNRSASAPEGLYRLKNEPLSKGNWVVLSARSDPAKWAAAQGFTGKGWPLIKQVSGVPGDRICREGEAVLINGHFAAAAFLLDNQGRDLPVWEGCVDLNEGDLFLLSPHPYSLDGRYFGKVFETDILGVAAPLLVSSAYGQDAE